MIELFILTLVFIRLFKRDVAQPLQEIASQVEQRWPPEDGKTLTPIDLPKNHQFDEIGQFVTVFNRSLKLTSDYLSFLKEDSDKAYTLSKTDTLTGAQNLRGINQKLDEVIKNLQNHWLIAVIDIDSFSQFNDSFGHDRGDVVLAKLYLHIEESMGNSGFIGRLNGGTFVYITSSHEEGFSEPLHRLEKVTSLELNEMVLSSTYTLTCSVGVLRVQPHQYHDPRKLLTNANAALQKAKSSGRGCVKLFDRQLADSNTERQAIRIQLLDVIKNQSFELVYQPKIDMRDYQVVGCEVLLRLPDLPNKAPFQLIEMAEKTGLIVQLGSLILNKAITELESISSLLPRNFKISINASPKQLSSSAFQDAFIDIMKNSSLKMSQLDIEITEVTSLQEKPETYENFRWLSKQGCSLTLDDFGTGFSTMEYLIKTGFDQMKLDQSFVRSLPHDEKSVKVICGILYLADLFNLSIVAEGVETEEQEAWLLSKKVHIAQGFLYAKGINIKAFKNLLENKNSIRNTV
ncbi:putative bifunctional diguanylate cyclase/phosphodiesterase [Vibrio sonorensis]|uniref:putative bifunctional diguanylate cyclase/phosphodiesterase n=1 Tax=Vibrio sonorensis TaxID=1004316 RepID=UPI0008D91769|nr:bifunctional diguanylate cyclase/phosphodiesterase [Vibrio sonorensis]